MSSATKMFREQQAAMAELQQSAVAIATCISAARRDLDALARHETLRTLLESQHNWLRATEAAVQAVRAWRDEDIHHYWSRLLGRWTVATILALLAAAAAGAGYTWAARPYHEEIAYLRSRDAFVNLVERRMLQMTPAERRQFHALLKLPPAAK